MRSMSEAAEQMKKDLSSPWRDRAGIAAYFGRSVRQITDWQREKVIPYVKQGRNIMFHIHKCEAALERYEVKSIAFSA